MNLLRVLALCAILIAAAVPASAQLAGDAIAGGYWLGGTNYFDPGVGLVPATANPLQPSAIVDTVDADYVEFTLWVADAVLGLGYGVYVDVDDDIITIDYVHQSGGSWNPAQITLTGLGDGTALGSLVEGENSLNATWSHTADSITVDVGQFYQSSGQVRRLVLGLHAAVPTGDGSVGQMKASFK